MLKAASTLALLLLLLQATIHPANAGRPIPYEYPEQLRHANMVMLKFQNALANERWDDALSHCSGIVKTAAKRRANLKEFFNETLPMDLVLANSRFGFWQESHGKKSHSYGMLFDLSPRGSKPQVQWFWSMFTHKDTWLIDWRPVKFDIEALTKEKQQQDAKRMKQVEAARATLKPKLRGVKTHLQPIDEEFVIGSPMRFRVELINYGKGQLNYTAAGVGYFPLRVLNEERQEIPCIAGSAQLMERRGALLPGKTEVLAENFDINRDYAFNKPGTYYVQYDGDSVNFGEWVETGRVHDPEFVATSMTFPSNIVKIEIKAKE